MSDTKDRILDAAEKLIADRGYAETSLRQLTGAAGVNLAAVHYHFGSKQALFVAVMERRVNPVNRERLARLDAIESNWEACQPSVEDLVACLFEPALVLHLRSAESATFLRLIGRVHQHMGELQEPLLELFGEVNRRFLTAFGRLLPELSPEALAWRMHFLVGLMCHTLCNGEMLKHASGGLCDCGDPIEVGRRMIQFAAAGMRASETAEAPAQ